MWLRLESDTALNYLTSVQFININLWTRNDQQILILGNSNQIHSPPNPEGVVSRGKRWGREKNTVGGTTANSQDLVNSQRTSKVGQFIIVYNNYCLFCMDRSNFQRKIDLIWFVLFVFMGHFSNFDILFNWDASSKCSKRVIVTFLDEVSLSFLEFMFYYWRVR